MEEAGGHRVVGEPIDDDETAHVTVLAVRVEGDRAVEMDVAHGDLVELQGARRGVLEGVHVHLVFGPVHAGPDGAGAQLEQVRAAGQHLLLGHPDDVGLELVGHAGGLARRGDDVTPAYVDLV